MKALRELLIILCIYFLGEFISRSLHLPVPGNILGMMMLLLSLCLGFIKVSQVESVSDFLLNHLAFFFVPAGVGIITSLHVLEGTWYKILLVCFITTIIGIGVTGFVVQFLKKRFCKGVNINE